MTSIATTSGFIDLYQRLNKDNLHLLEEVYHANVTFQDPLHRIDGLDNLKKYFEQMYENLNHGSFDIHNSLFQDQTASLYWTMHFSHKKLKGGQNLIFEGNTYLMFEEDKVIFHRDYFDAGAMLYEHIPLLSGAIRFIKNRVSV